MSTESVKQVVRDAYGQIARSAPSDAPMGLGCGEPLAQAGLQPGEVVLDLGCGGGFECLQAAAAVGPSGSVIGVDMTPEMLERARARASARGVGNVEFRSGDLERLPVETASVDVVISNCVLNLVPDKRRAFAEAWRVLRPGGRLHMADIVLAGELPASVLCAPQAYCACVAGAMVREEYLQVVAEAGFELITVHADRPAGELLTGSCCTPQAEPGECCAEAQCCAGPTPAELAEAAQRVRSLTFSACKPVAPPD